LIFNDFIFIRRACKTSAIVSLVFTARWSASYRWLSLATQRNAQP